VGFAEGRGGLPPGLKFPGLGCASQCRAHGGRLGSGSDSGPDSDVYEKGEACLNGLYAVLSSGMVFRASFSEIENGHRG